MPNNTTNRLIVMGAKQEVLRFIAMVKTKESNLDFNAVVPLPAELEGSTSPVKILTQKQIDDAKAEYAALSKAERDEHESWVGVIGEHYFGMTAETKKRLMLEYGAADWYDWCVKNWGTKWNSYDCGEWYIGDIISEITYYTAWTPPREFLLTASQEFPSLKFENSYADEGGGFLGYDVIKDGILVKRVNYEWDSEDGAKLKSNLGIEDYSEDEE